MDRDSSFDMATHFGLDRLGIESRWGSEIFHTRPDRSCSPLSILYKGYRVILGCKAVNTPSCAAVKERVELYLYMSSVPARQGT